jgi:phage portal protein BeeE
MGILASVLRRPDRIGYRYAPYKTITEYAPVFSSYGGSLYEQQLTRSCIERIATACSKLKPEVEGTAKPRIKRIIKTAPNDYMTWSTLLARVATILETDTTAFVVPAYDTEGNITGLWPLKAENVELIERGDEPWLRFYLASGDAMAIEQRNVCILTRFQYESDVFGGGNQPLNETLKLMNHQVEAQDAAIKNGASIRFIGKLEGMIRPSDMEEKRQKFTDDNLSAQNQSGLMVYDNTWQDIKQIDPQTYTVGTEEMERIEKSVYTYFGINEDILTNDFSEEQWGAFYESVVEPIAIQLGDGLSQMLYTPGERARGNKISFSSNRLEYASNASKRNMIRDMGDRGVFSVDDMRAILQLPPLPNGAGQVYIMRGEYYMLDSNYNVIAQSGGEGNGKLAPSMDDDRDPIDLTGDDDIYNDNDTRGHEDIEEGK